LPLVRRVARRHLGRHLALSGMPAPRLTAPESDSC
jgi:hypothetical protein